MKTRNGYDLNTLLIIVNFCVCAIAIVFYYNKGDNQYVDIYTIIILCIFGAQNFLILLYEKKKRDPFVLLLMIIALVFYMGRVVTLSYDPWSTVLERNLNFSPDDLNYSLIFIMFSHASIVLGFSTAGGEILYKKKEGFNDYPANPRNIIIILLFAIVIAFYASLASDIIGRFVGYITGTFIKLQLILLLSFIYIAVNFKKILNRSLIIFLILIVTFIIFTTLSGSRSALLTLGVLLLVGLLSLKGRITLNKKYTFLSTMLVPLSMILFISATYIRGSGINRAVVSTQQLTFLKELPLFQSDNIYRTVRPIFNRMGFLDYSADMIKKEGQYNQIINFQYYFKNIIDNVLTPGFNIFDTPRVAHSYSYIARGKSVPTYEKIKAAYQADMPTVYGEYYLLFHGYPALIIFFSFSFIFKKIYLSIRSKDAFLFYMYRAVILYVFYLWLNSFGIDWMMLDLIGIIITIGLFKNFYKMRRRKIKSVYRSEEHVGDTSL